MPTVKELTALRDFYNTGETRSYAYRKTQLLKFRQAITDHEAEIFKALYTDLKKSKEECWVTENGMLISEISHIVKHLKDWMEPEKVATNLLNFPSKSFILKEPLGVVLVIAPWNYPLQLLFAPLAGAIAAGNCVVLKSSEFAPATSAVMKDIIEKTFERNYILFTEGDGATVVSDMMNNFTFDHIFYTGSTNVGRLIYQQAAAKLTPVTLELGGKSPCVIEADADIKVAAKRIAVTKFSNAGQMCVAPDYLLVHASVTGKLIEELKKVITQFFGSDPSLSDDYGKIINEKQFDRLLSFLDKDVLTGGEHNRNKLYIAPTILKASAGDNIMKEEIFGPLLPVLSFTEKDEALNIIRQNMNPLAFYIFTSSKASENFWLQNVAFGGGCVNNASWHLTNPNLPFGGRGFSGTGSYHGKFSFDTFSHKKAIMKTPVWFDPSAKYPPYRGKLKLLKMFIGK